MQEQVTKDERDITERLRDVERYFSTMNNRLRIEAADTITDLRASLRREENARKVLADENTRLRERYESLLSERDMP